MAKQQDPRGIVRAKIESYNAKAWTMSGGMVDGWLTEALGRAPNAKEQSEGMAEYQATNFAALREDR
jgi:hypothetical protein